VGARVYAWGKRVLQEIVLAQTGLFCIYTLLNPNLKPMTVTLNIKDDRLDEFWAYIQAQNLLEDDDIPFVVPETVPQWQIDEVMRSQAAPNRLEPRAWSEVREKYGVGLCGAHLINVNGNR
jgi:hypothetical protein